MTTQPEDIDPADVETSAAGTSEPVPAPENLDPTNPESAPLAPGYHDVAPDDEEQQQD